MPQLVKVFTVFAQEISSLLHLVAVIVAVAIGDQRAYAAVSVFFDDTLLAFRQGVEAYKIYLLVSASIGKGGYILRHMAVGHASVGFVLLFQSRPKFGIVFVQRMVELQVTALERAQRRVFNIPFANSLQVVQVHEEVVGVYTVAVDLREVAEHYVAKRHELFEGLIFAVGTANRLMHQVKLEEQELVGHYLHTPKVGHQVVNHRHLRQEETLSLLSRDTFKSATHEEFRAVVVEHHQHPVGICGMCGQYPARRLFQERFHLCACSRVSGLPTSSHLSAG